MRWMNWMSVTGVLSVAVLLAVLTSASADDKKPEEKPKEPTAEEKKQAENQKKMSQLALAYQLIEMGRADAGEERPTKPDLILAAMKILYDLNMKFDAGTETAEVVEKGDEKATDDKTKIPTTSIDLARQLQEEEIKTLKLAAKEKDVFVARGAKILEGGRSPQTGLNRYVSALKPGQINSYEIPMVKGVPFAVLLRSSNGQPLELTVSHVNHGVIGRRTGNAFTWNFNTANGKNDPPRHKLTVKNVGNAATQFELLVN